MRIIYSRKYFVWKFPIITLLQLVYRVQCDSRSVTARCKSGTGDGKQYNNVPDISYLGNKLTRTTLHWKIETAIEENVREWTGHLRLNALSNQSALAASRDLYWAWRHGCYTRCACAFRRERSLYLYCTLDFVARDVEVCRRSLLYFNICISLY